jgi:hypothetical protein
MEGRIVLEEMLARFSRIEQAGAVERVPSMTRTRSCRWSSPDLPG